MIPKKFVEECIYGIQASGDTKLSSIVRAIDDDVRPIDTEKRLSRNLDDATLESSVAEAVLKDGARSVRGDTLLLVDPTEIRKEFSYKMEFVTRVRDAKGRSVLSRGGMHEVHDLARQCTMSHSHHVTFDSHGKECNVPISFGAMPVRLPMHPEKELHLVVVKGFGQDPMMLLTSLPVDGTFKSQWRIVEAYLSRWRIEETIRFVKQSYGFENIRVTTYARIRNMASLVLASAYFATVWIGRNIKREALAEHLAHLVKRLGEVPEFAAYAIADGIRRAFTRFGKWVRTAADTIAKAHDAPAIQLLPGFAELLDTDDG